MSSREEYQGPPARHIKGWVKACTKSPAAVSAALQAGSVGSATQGSVGSAAQGSVVQPLRGWVRVQVHGLGSRG